MTPRSNAVLLSMIESRWRWDTPFEIGEVDGELDRLARLDSRPLPPAPWQRRDYPPLYAWNDRPYFAPPPHFGPPRPPVRCYVEGCRSVVTHSNPEDLNDYACDEHAQT